MTREAVVRFLLWLWHESFGEHDWRCTGRGELHGRPFFDLECDCGAEITHLDVSEIPS